jgi:hypothetical protein
MARAVCGIARTHHKQGVAWRDELESLLEAKWRAIPKEVGVADLKCVGKIPLTKEAAT